MLKIIETPRDGIHGIAEFIPTKKKVEFINTLLKVGFDTLEVGSFVSKKAIPQMADTAEVLRKIDLSETHTKIMVLVANLKGAKKALQFDQIESISFPFSVSPSFLDKNINSSFEKGFQDIENILDLTIKSGKELIVYLAMGFGNPYGDDWSIELLEYLAGKLYYLGLITIPLSDITGESTVENIEKVFKALQSRFPKIEFGFHLHASPNEWYAKTEAAYRAGCRRFDTVTGGLGGCPMTGKELLANLNTLDFLTLLDEKEVPFNLNMYRLIEARDMAQGFLSP